MRGRGGWGRARLTYKKKFCQFRLSESIFFVFLYILCTASCRTCDCVRMRTYLPNYGYLFEKTSSANKKYTYRKIDTHYCGQTAFTTPSGVKAYVAQSNPLHSWVTCDKNRNFHLTHGTYPWHICKISPITKVHYLLEFCKKTPVNNQPVKNLTPAEKILPEKK